MPAPEGLNIAVTDALVDELVERVGERLARPTAEPWVGVEADAAHLGCTVSIALMRRALRLLRHETPVSWSESFHGSNVDAGRG
jgi:hypothetical protein